MGSEYKQKSEEDALQDLSSKMLCGWKLLGEVCPIVGCDTPLVKSPDGTQIWCGRCAAKVVLSDSVDSLPEMQKAKNVSEIQEDTSAPFEKVEIVTTEENSALNRKDRDAASQRMGAKLLRGWTMLEDSCDDCMTPLLRSPEEQLYCCGCEHFVNVEEEEEEEEEEESSVNTFNDWSPMPKQEEANEASAVLSRHLLGGWTMLAETCEKCQSPLMCDKDSKTARCVQPRCSCIEENSFPAQGTLRSKASTSMLVNTAIETRQAVEAKVNYLLSTLANCDLTQTAAAAAAIASLGRATVALARCEEEEASPERNRIVSASSLHTTALISKLHACTSDLAATTDPKTLNDAALALTALADAALALSALTD